MNNATIPELEKKAIELRKTALSMIYQAKSGHPGGSLSAGMGKGKVVRIGVRDQFGESAPYEELLAMNGITAEKITEAALELMGR